MPATSASNLLGWNAGQIDPEGGRTGDFRDCPLLLTPGGISFHQDPYHGALGSRGGRDHRSQDSCLASPQVRVGTGPPPPHLRLDSLGKAESSVEEEPTAAGSWLSPSLEG